MSVTFSVVLGEGLPHDGEEQYSTVVVAVEAVSFLLVRRDDVSAMHVSSSQYCKGVHGDGRGGRSSCQP